MFKFNGLQLCDEIALNNGKNHTVFEIPSRVDDVERLEVGSIGAYTFLRGGVFKNVDRIGRFCSLAPRLVIGPEEHKSSVLSTSTFLNSDNWGEEAASYWARNPEERTRVLGRIRESGTRNLLKVNIGNDVWIGDGAIVRRGVTIGDGAIVGANSLVTRDVEPYSIVLGLPAVHLRYRFDIKLIDIFKQVRWWDRDLSCLDGIEWSDPGVAARQLLERLNRNELIDANYATWSAH